MISSKGSDDGILQLVLLGPDFAHRLVFWKVHNVSETVFFFYPSSGGKGETKLSQIEISSF
jgi:hypothetical protein